MRLPRARYLARGSVTTEAVALPEGGARDVPAEGPRDEADHVEPRAGRVATVTAVLQPRLRAAREFRAVVAVARALVFEGDLRDADPRPGLDARVEAPAGVAQRGHGEVVDDALDEPRVTEHREVGGRGEHAQPRGGAALVAVALGHGGEHRREGHGAAGQGRRAGGLHARDRGVVVDEAQQQVAAVAKVAQRALRVGVVGGGDHLQEGEVGDDGREGVAEVVRHEQREVFFGAEPVRDGVVHPAGRYAITARGGRGSPGARGRWCWLRRGRGSPRCRRAARGGGREWT